MSKVIAASRRLLDGAWVAMHRAREFSTRREEGASLVEYALLVALIALACVVAISALGGGISTAYNNIKTTLGGYI